MLSPQSYGSFVYIDKDGFSHLDNGIMDVVTGRCRVLCCIFRVSSHICNLTMGLAYVAVLKT